MEIILPILMAALLVIGSSSLPLEGTQPDIGDSGEDNQPEPAIRGVRQVAGSGKSDLATASTFGYPGIYNGGGGLYGGGLYGGGLYGGGLYGGGLGGLGGYSALNSLGTGSLSGLYGGYGLGSLYGGGFGGLGGGLGGLGGYYGGTGLGLGGFGGGIGNGLYGGYPFAG